MQAGQTLARFPSLVIPPQSEESVSYMKAAESLRCAQDDGKLGDLDAAKPIGPFDPPDRGRGRPNVLATFATSSLPGPSLAQAHDPAVDGTEK
jgi:hypothetical protein